MKYLKDYFAGRNSNSVAIALLVCGFCPGCTSPASKSEDRKSALRRQLGSQIAKLLPIVGEKHRMLADPNLSKTWNAKGLRLLAFDVIVPTGLKVVEAKSAVIFKNGGILSLMIDTPVSESSKVKREGELRARMLSKRSGKVYVFDGPKFVGSSFTVGSSGGSSLIVDTTNGHATHVFASLDYPPGVKPDLDQDVAIVNTLIQSIQIVKE